MNPSWVGVTATISIFVLAHIIATVWWASKVDTILNMVQKNLIDLVTELKAIRISTYSKEEASKDLVLNQKEHEAMWRKIDNLNDKINLNNGGK